MKTVRCDEMPTAYGNRSRCKRGAKRRDIAEFGIGEDRREREPGGAHLAQQASAPCRHFS